MIPSRKKIKVLVVDDSFVVRRAISDVLNADPDIEVVGTAADPYIARDKILELNPDVLTLDIEMPRMDGITFLHILKQHRPMPVIVISSLTQAGSKAALEALEAGAVDVMAKPNSSWSIGDLGARLPHRIKGAAVARMGSHAAMHATAPARPALVDESQFSPRQLILLGSSTGGTEALKRVLTQLPATLPGIAIVQHMPPVFSKAFAERLNGQCQLEVREAVSGDVLRPGLALIAPGDYHMMLCWNNGSYRVVLNQSPPLHHTRPAVDLLFKSAAASAGKHAVAGILTGMGCDGAEGLLALRQAGAATFAQNEQTCVVYGMPRAAVEMGAAEEVLALDDIPQAIIRGVLNRTGKAARSLEPVHH